MAKKDQYIPSRRHTDAPRRKKVFSYYTVKEHNLIDRAARKEEISLSSFVAKAAIKKAKEMLGVS